MQTTNTRTGGHPVRLAVASAVVAVLLVVGFTVAQTYRVSADRPAPASVVARLDPSVQRTLQVLDRLRSYGYVINTPARADRAIRSWQRSNGLVVDGIVGIQTYASVIGPVVPSPVRPAITPSEPPAAAVADPGRSGGDVESIIRDVWPDDVEDWAVRIATRESRLQPTAANSCCYGLFQIHFRAHRAWLADYGVTTPADLFDPTVNATVALALYQSTGPGPWSL